MLAKEFIDQDIEATTAYAAQQDLAKSIEANDLAHKVLDEILAVVRPGCRESEVKAHTYAVYEAHAVERPWHMPYIRFGAHTLLTFRDKPKEDLVLGENDIAFVDIGIVKNGVEGDAGRTIVFGEDAVLAELAKASRDIFDEMAAYWREHDPSGEELYDEVRAAAERRGFAFNLEPAGHLIGTFPHKGWKHGLNHFPGKVEKGIWVLEIQLRHKERDCGAFYEALLY